MLDGLLYRLYGQITAVRYDYSVYTAVYLFGLR